jgi:hypothetical protein
MIGCRKVHPISSSPFPLHIFFLSRLTAFNVFQGALKTIPLIRFLWGPTDCHPPFCNLHSNRLKYFRPQNLPHNSLQMVTKDAPKMHQRCTKDAPKMHQRCTKDAPTTNVGWMEITKINWIFQHEQLLRGKNPVLFVLFSFALFQAHTVMYLCVVLVCFSLFCYAFSNHGTSELS